MSKSRFRGLALLFIAGHLLLTLAYSVLNPLGEAPDEADHWAVVVHLAREKEFPVGPRITQSKHPPLYHMGAALATAIAEADNTFMRSNPDVELTPRPGWSPNFFIHTAYEAWPWNRRILAYHMARFWSVFLSTATVLATFLLGCKAFPDRPWTTLAATGILAFVPEFAFIGAAINNDNAAALFGTVAILGGLTLYRAGARFSAAWWTPLALGLGLLTKLSTLAIWPMVALAIVWGAVADVKRRQGSKATVWLSVTSSWHRWVGTGLLVFLPALAIGSPWLARNWRLYGDPLGMSMARQTIDLRSGPWTGADSLWLLRGWFISFWGKFGGAGHIPMPDWIYWGMAALSVLSLIGLFRLWIGPDRRRVRPSIALLAAALAGVIIVIWRYSQLALGTDQGRLLYPAVAAIILLFAAGLMALIPERRRPAAGWTLVGGALVLGVYALAGIIVPTFAPPDPLSTADLPTIDTENRISFGELALIGWTLAPEPILYWQADGEPLQDWRAVLRIRAADGGQIWERQRSPGAGRWATDRWPAGAIMADEYQIDWPDWVGPGRYSVEVALRPQGRDPVIPMGMESVFVLLGHIERE